MGVRLDRQDPAAARSPYRCGVPPMNRISRKPPQSPHAHSGHCQWCGDPVRPGPTGRDRGWHQGRDEEPDCLRTYFIANGHHEAAKRALVARDGGRCQDCGQCCYVAVKHMTYWGAGEVARDPDSGRCSEYPHSVVSWHRIKAWQIEHEVPLWSIDRSLPWEQLIQYWLLPNLRTCCEDCHKAKTAREAVQRAKEKRQHRKLGPGRSKEPAPSLLSRDGQRLT
jgi:5-methylcytosine-specific restriction endonuclease McrA